MTLIIRNFKYLCGKDKGQVDKECMKQLIIWLLSDTLEVDDDWELIHNDSADITERLCLIDMYNEMLRFYSDYNIYLKIIGETINNDVSREEKRCNKIRSNPK